MLLLLTGCGFKPMYADEAMGDRSNAMRGNVAIDPIHGEKREAQILKIALEDKFNPESLDSSHAQYHLAVSVRKSLVPAVVKSDGTIQRYEVHFDTVFQLLKSGGGGKAELAGTLGRTGSYNVAVNANFATYEAEHDVIERTLQELAEDYVLRISGFLAGKSGG